ncbi:MAG: hypothetical protein HY681_11325 [Chloroflexi bacterium]|nr:hypothetical protein [Chloroflexota bacterium]
MKTVRHFDVDVVRKHVEANRVDWVESVLRSPVAEEVQEDGRIRYWGYIAEADRFMRVVTLGDGETVVTAFFDRNFGHRERGRPG